MVSILAHRGASAVCRENTIDAFRAARQSGADGVELDVRRSADGVLVVHHDPALPDGRALASVTSAELPAWLPTLQAALEECRGLLVDIEVKNLPTEPGYDPDERAAVGSAELAVRLGLAGSVTVSSFTLASIDAAKAACPGLATGWLTLAWYDQDAALALVAEHGHASLHPRHEAVTPELVAAAHDLGLAVWAWTVDEPERIVWLSETGVDALITNTPDAALRAVGR